jgi:hypothetical protein
MKILRDALFNYWTGLFWAVDEVGYFALITWKLLKKALCFCRYCEWHLKIRKSLAA